MLDKISIQLKDAFITGNCMEIVLYSWKILRGLIQGNLNHERLRGLYASRTTII